MGSLTIFNEFGDQTIVWTEDRDEAMTQIIAKKMAEGVRFFIIERRTDGLPDGRVKLDDAEEARKHRALSIPDEDFAQFVSAGNAEVVKTPRGRVTKSRFSNDASEVARNTSIGTKQRKAG